jgi:hypothetical protein
MVIGFSNSMQHMQMRFFTWAWMFPKLMHLGVDSYIRKRYNTIGTDVTL